MSKRKEIEALKDELFDCEDECDNLRKALDHAEDYAQAWRERADYEHEAKLALQAGVKQLSQDIITLMAELMFKAAIAAEEPEA